MTDALFAFHEVSVDVGPAHLLGPVDLTIANSGITVVSGPSGAGKSTLLRLCNRLEVPTGGSITHRGRELREWDVLELRRQVGMVFQNAALFGGSVRDNLAVAAPKRSDRFYRESLEQAALDPALLDQEAATLSGGEAQRLCLARTMATTPRVLLLDEPTSALDDAATRAFEATARALSDGGVPIIWVSHSADQINRIADAHIAVRDGVIDTTTDRPEEIR